MINWAILMITSSSPPSIPQIGQNRVLGLKYLFQFKTKFQIPIKRAKRAKRVFILLKDPKGDEIKKGYKVFIKFKKL